MQIDITQSLPDFSLAKMSFLFSPAILSLILVVFFIFYFIGSAVLWYHWSKYGMGRREISVVKVLFLFVSAALFVFATLGIYYS